MPRKFEFKEELLGVVLVLSLLAFQNCAKPNDLASSDTSAPSSVPAANAGLDTKIWPGSTSNGSLLIPPPTTANPTPASSAVTCVDNSVTYGENATAYGDPCPGNSCASVIGPKLTCTSGQWYYSNGTNLCAAGVPTAYGDQTSGTNYLGTMGCSI
jgi:hypothetical protein